MRCWVKRKLHWDWEFSIATISPHNLSEPAWVQFHKNIESHLHLYLRAPERRDKCINTWGFVMWQSNFVPWPKFRDCFDVVVLQLFSRCVHLCISWDLHFPYLFPIFKCVKTIYRFFFYQPHNQSTTILCVLKPHCPHFWLCKTHRKNCMFSHRISFDEMPERTCWIMQSTNFTSLFLFNQKSAVLQTLVLKGQIEQQNNISHNPKTSAFPRSWVGEPRSLRNMESDETSDQENSFYIILLVLSQILWSGFKWQATTSLFQWATYTKQDVVSTHEIRKVFFF